MKYEITEKTHPKTGKPIWVLTLEDKLKDFKAFQAEMKKNIPLFFKYYPNQNGIVFYENPAELLSNFLPNYSDVLTIDGSDYVVKWKPVNSEVETKSNVIDKIKNMPTGRVRKNNPLIDDIFDNIIEISGYGNTGYTNEHFDIPFEKIDEISQELKAEVLDRFTLIYKGQLKFSLHIHSNLFYDFVVGDKVLKREMLKAYEDSKGFKADSFLLSGIDVKEGERVIVSSNGKAHYVKEIFTNCVIVSDYDNKLTEFWKNGELWISSKGVHLEKAVLFQFDFKYNPRTGVEKVFKEKLLRELGKEFYLSRLDNDSANIIHVVSNKSKNSYELLDNGGEWKVNVKNNDSGDLIGRFEIDMNMGDIEKDAFEIANEIKLIEDSIMNETKVIEPKYEYGKGGVYYKDGKAFHLIDNNGNVEKLPYSPAGGYETFLKLIAETKEGETYVWKDVPKKEPNYVPLNEAIEFQETGYKDEVERQKATGDYVEGQGISLYSLSKHLDENPVKQPDAITGVLANSKGGSLYEKTQIDLAVTDLINWNNAQFINFPDTHEITSRLITVKLYLSVNRPELEDKAHEVFEAFQLRIGEVNQNPVTKPKYEAITNVLAESKGGSKEVKPVDIFANYSNQHELNEAIVSLIKDKPLNYAFTDTEKAFIYKYEGSGGLAKFGAEGVGLLHEYYTPTELIEKLWGLAYQYGFSGGKVLEPSVGIGRVLDYVNFTNTTVTAYEISLISKRICEIMHPFANVKLGSFSNHFYGSDRMANVYNDKFEKDYDLVIGNPPYGEITDLRAEAEKGRLKAGNMRFEHYFILRGLDTLKSGGLLIYVSTANLFLKGYEQVKERISERAELLDGFLLPSSTFKTTKINTSIIVLRKK
jgi:hypothetical protein